MFKKFFTFLLALVLPPPKPVEKPKPMKGSVVYKDNESYFEMLKVLVDPQSHWVRVVNKWFDLADHLYSARFSLLANEDGKTFKLTSKGSSLKADKLSEIVGPLDGISEENGFKLLEEYVHAMAARGFICVEDSVETLKTFYLASKKNSQSTASKIVKFSETDVSVAVNSIEITFSKHPISGRRINYITLITGSNSKELAAIHTTVRISFTDMNSMSKKTVR